MNKPAAIIDIGSNSVRLVILSGISRSPEELYSEQLYPHLGKQIARTGRLDSGGVTMCLEGLSRFVRLCNLMEVTERIVVATAAIREATDGARFVAMAKERCGLDVRVISGEDEGRLSAMGVIAGIPDASGIVGDLGGGSLELAVVRNGTVGQHVSLPLGPFRLMREGTIQDHRAAIVKSIDLQLADVDWLGKEGRNNFYAVGGNWRAIAKAQMKRDRCPLPMVHQHMLPASSGIEVADYISTLSPSGLERVGVQKKRAKLVPYAALVMERVLRVTRPNTLVFSGFGLREGLVYDRLSPQQRAEDPLVATCERLAKDVAYGQAVHRWCAGLELPGSPRESVRLATCLLSTMQAGEDPGQRGRNAYDRILHLQTGGLDHQGRAFLALVMYYRFYRAKDEPADDILRRSEAVLTTVLMRDARRLGEVLNFASGFSANVAGVLSASSLAPDNGRLMLRVSAEDGSLLTQDLTRDLEQLAKDLRLKSTPAQSMKP